VDVAGARLRPKNFDQILEAAQQILQVFRESDEKTWSEKYETLWFQKLDEFASLVFRNKELQDYLSFDDLRDRLFHIVMYLGKDLKDITPEDLKNYLGKLLGAPDMYEFFFPALELFNFPDGYILGSCELHSFTQLPQQIQTQISSEWKYRYEREKNIYLVRSFDEYQERKKRETYFCLSVQALGNEKAIETATRLANQGLNILKCFYPLEHAPRLVACHYKVGASYGAVREERFIWGWHNHWTDKEIEGYLRIVNDFVRRRTDDEIARRCLSAIDIYGMMEKETALKLKFLLSIMATESLLLGKDDKDFLGWKLREKVAILLGDTPNWVKQHLSKSPKDSLTREECDQARPAARAELAKKVGMIYDKRSALVHQDAGEEITEDDFRFASMIMRFSLHRILRLYNEKGITRVSKTSTVDPQSLDGFIESMKYSVPLGW
jgi:hypothetical protein